jgi:hypothetical protein
MHMRGWGKPGIALGLSAGVILLYTVSTPRDTMAATGAIAALLAIRSWLTRLGDRLTDATKERKRLADLTAQCLAADMANIADRQRIRIDSVNAERAADERAAEAEANAERRIAEITEKLRREYEETRAVELCKSYLQGATNERSGLHKDPQAMAGELIILSERRRTAPKTGLGITSP